MDIRSIDSRTFLVQEEPRGPSQLIEIPVTQNGLGKVQLPDVPNLRNQADQTVIIKAIRVIPPTVLTNSPTLGSPVAPLAEMQKLSLTIYSEQWEKGQNIPVLTLVDTFTEASGIPWRNRTAQFANWQNVDWNKCFLQYSNGTVSAGQPYALVLEVEYVKIIMLRDPQGNFTGEYREVIGPN